MTRVRRARAQLSAFHFIYYIARASTLAVQDCLEAGMTVDTHFANIHLRNIRRWKLTVAQKEKLQVVILVSATLGMVAVFIARFHTLFAA